VPIVEINDTKLVVDLGNGHNVDLVGLLANISIIKNNETPISFEKYTKRLKAHEMVVYIYKEAIHENQLFCKIPFTSTVSRGGRQSKVRRSRRLHRRVTRRTRR
jgi:hypothetical protein